ncbi:hypothetical protein V1478_010928, partial [Vespula squamosa]
YFDDSRVISRDKVYQNEKIFYVEKIKLSKGQLSCWSSHREFIGLFSSNRLNGGEDCTIEKFFVLCDDALFHENRPSRHWLYERVGLRKKEEEVDDEEEDEDEEEEEEKEEKGGAARTRSLRAPTQKQAPQTAARISEPNRNVLCAVDKIAESCQRSLPRNDPGWQESVCPEDRKGVLGGVGDARCPESLVAGTGQQETGSKVIRREPENRRQMRMPFSEPVTVVPPGLQGGLQLYY